MGDHNQAIQQDGIQTVTSVGNSWIICRSKSHAGRIYYFNTFSGEAAWNLSDQEIEKAKTRTKMLESQSGGKFEGCPEPKDPPIDNPQTSHVYIPSRVYNKQIINNRFPNQSISPTVASQCAKCRPVATIDAMGVNFSIPHKCNPVWTVPPNHQIVIASTPPIVNPLQTVVNSLCNNIGQQVSIGNTSLPLSHRFKQMQVPERNLGFGFNKRKTNNGFGQKNAGSPYHKNFNRCTNLIDLRQRLIARRSNNVWNNSNEHSNYQDENVGNSTIQRIQIIKPTIEDIAPNYSDDQWLKDNATVQGTQLLLNVAPLKQLITTDLNSIWYIVVDTGVLLKHINLINVIVNSDEMCQLMVPDFIMAALQTKSRADDSQMLTRAHHILQILSRQFTAGKAVMGKDPTSNNSVYDFCYKLSALNHDVVLISDNSQWENINSIITINVQELKDMLSNAVKPVKRLVDNCNFKITIPNVIYTEKDKNMSDSNTISEQFDSTKNELNETQTNSCRNFNLNKVVISTPKSTADRETQTFPQKLHSVGVNTEISCIGNLNETSKEQFTCKRVADFDEIPKRKEIRLKRNPSYQPVPDNDNNVEKKQFKWRRKRNALMSFANATDKNPSPYSSNVFNIEENSKGNLCLTPRTPEPSRLDNIFIPDSKSTCYESIDDSETSSLVYVQKVDAKVVIEETSTSGIISNSADSESMHSIKHNKQSYNKDVCTCVMFEVVSPIMEEYLKIKSDEWVSRFVQIMEEILTQILQQTPAYFNRTLPPPWTIHEATECIKKKFENDSDVKDAANRLTNVLFKVSDGRGQISVDLKPSEFMEMYSYGVYLVDALQSVFSNCEDLQTASDSLAKLLRDIQDTSLDTSHADAFMDSAHLPLTEVSEISTDTGIIHNDVETDSPKRKNKLPDMKSPTSSSPKTGGRKYNLRSTIKNTKNDVPTEEPVIFIRNIDIESTFFSSLNLKKNQDSAENSNTIATNRSATSPNSLFTSKNKIPESVNNTEIQNDTEAQNDKSSNEPKIIRNFSKCLEFEEKLKNKQNHSMKVDTLDYSQDNYDDEYYDDDSYEYYDDYTYSGYDDYYENDEEIDKNESHEIVKTTVVKNGNTDFKSLIRRLVNEIQETFLEVHSFCAKVIEELSVYKTLNYTLSPPRKLEIKGKAEAARLGIDTLSKSLNGILSREEGNCEDKIQNILKEAGIHLDGNESNEYRNIIAQYPRQANILLDAVNIVIEAVT